MKPALIIGNGPMAADYAKVFREGLKIPFAAAGRDAGRIRAFAEREGAEESLLIDELDGRKLDAFQFAVLATSPDSLYDLGSRLLSAGCGNLLIEKPVALSLRDFSRLRELADEKGAFVRVAVNRRYYKSVQTLKAILKREKPRAAFFDFSELLNRIPFANYQKISLDRWGLTNSIHVFDTAVHLLGAPRNLKAEVRDQGLCEWHRDGGTFLGTLDLGETPTSFVASWICPGRWDLQVLTEKGRYKLSPFEKLQVLEHGTVVWKELPLDDEVDLRFKPGLYQMVSDFAQKGPSHLLPDLQEASVSFKFICSTLGYD